MTSEVMEMLDVLSNIYSKCDVDGEGVVNIDILINVLTSQDPSWQGDKRVEDELRKLLCQNGTIDLISKEHFISSFLHETKFNLSSEQVCTEECKEISLDDHENKGSSLSSGIGESSEITSASSLNSIEGNLSPVSYDGRLNLNELGVEDIYITENESPQVDLKVKALEREIYALHRKNEGLECANSYLLGQIASLEDSLNKHKKWTTDISDKMQSSNQQLELCKQRYEETEEKLNKTIDENKSATIQLSQCERENSKLKEFISKLEKQIDQISSEKNQQNSKIVKMNENMNLKENLLLKIQAELDKVTLKGESDKESREKLIEENKTLQLQLESSALYLKDLKSAHAVALKNISRLQNAKIESKLQLEKLPEELSPDSSVVFYDNHFDSEVTSKIPFETSLRAELQIDKECIQECEFCKRRFSFSSSSPFNSTNDITTQGTNCSSFEEKKFVDGSTMTVNGGNCIARADVTFKDVGVNCTIKNLSEDKKNEFGCMHCHVRLKRSVSIKLCTVLLVLCFLLGFFASLVLLTYSLMMQPSVAKFRFTFTSLLCDLLHVKIEYKNSFGVIL